MSKRVGHEVPGVVAALFSKVGSEDITCKNADRPEHISLVERACLYSGKCKSFPLEYPEEKITLVVTVYAIYFSNCF